MRRSPMYSLSHSGLALAAVGRYAEAARVFEETRAFGRKYGVVPLLARGTSMSAGYHFSLEDYDTAEQSSSRPASWLGG